MEEDPMNQARGHKAAINNPNVSEEAKAHSKKVIHNEFGAGTVYDQKNPGNVYGYSYARSEVETKRGLFLANDIQRRRAEGCHK